MKDPHGSAYIIQTHEKNEHGLELGVRHLLNRVDIVAQMIAGHSSEKHTIETFSGKLQVFAGV